MSDGKVRTLADFDSRKLGFLISVCAVFGSLYFSEVLKFPPCVLCWYQRIALYPLAILYSVALWTDDRNSRRYTLPLLVIGLVIALYHNLLYYGFVSEALTPCTEGIPCSSRQLQLFGFITIPLLSLTALAVMTLAELLAHSQRKMKAVK